MLFCCLTITLTNYSFAFAQSGPSGTFVCGGPEDVDLSRVIFDAVFNFILAPSGLLLTIVTTIAAIVAGALRELHLAAFFAFVAASSYSLRLFTEFFFGLV